VGVGVGAQVRCHPLLSLFLLCSDPDLKHSARKTEPVLASHENACDVMHTGIRLAPATDGPAGQHMPSGWHLMGPSTAPRTWLG
jgi:hypothetical protein